MTNMGMASVRKVHPLFGYVRGIIKFRQGGRIKMRSPPKVLTGNFRPSQLSSFLS